MQPWYSGRVTAAADAALGLIEAGERVTHLRSEGAYAHIFSELSEVGKPALSLDLDTLHFYTALYASLFLAFPGLRLKTRIGALLAAMAALFAFHVLVLLINVEHMYAVTMTDVSARNYTGAARAAHRWLHDGADFLAVQLVPAIALVTLYFTTRQDPGSNHHRSPWRAAAAATVVALLAVGAVAAAFAAQRPRVAARQAESLCARAYRMLQQPDVAAALPLFERSVALNPDFAQAQDGLGLTLMRMSRPAEAAERYRLAIALSPSDPLAHLHLGNALTTLGDHAAALAEYEAVLRIDPRHREGMYNVAVLQKKLGRAEESVETLRSLLRLHPDYAPALFDLSASMISRRQACGALEYLRRLSTLEQDPQRLSLVRATVADLEVSCARVQP
ncbi:MAG TPA: tetratricopeptide repeat protein [Candidatus Polarisedimenticolia bacterium]|nr:tetratricopeptide repeat protein [Candidatus Polarisedimenticolia bacterium]